MWDAQFFPTPVNIENSSVNVFAQHLQTLPLLFVSLPENLIAFGDTPNNLVISTIIGLNSKP